MTYKLVIVVTVSATLSFYRGQLEYLSERGFEIDVICSGGRELHELCQTHHVHDLKITREISLLHDLATLARLTKLFFSIKPHIVHGSTPKAGFISMMAATLARVPIKLYTVRGLPLETASGVGRRVLSFVERLTCACASRVFVNSRSASEVLLTMNLCPPHKMIVLHNGSSNGVDAIKRFNPNLFDDQSVVQLKKSLGIDVDQKVIGFVGRLAIDKGLAELVHAWKVVRGRNRSACLLILGGEDERDPAPDTLIRDLKSDPRVRMVGSIDNAKAPLYYAAMNLLALPTYREGFPNVVLEASAMELPVVACKVTGCVDAVVDGVTGTLVPARDSLNLANSIIKYLDNPEMCKKHGRAGRLRALTDFRPEDLWEAVYDEYSYQLKEKRVAMTPDRLIYHLGKSQF